MTPRRIDAILISTNDGARLVSFYRDALGISLEIEQHDSTAPHWGCFLDNVHFAIREDQSQRIDRSFFSLSFEVDDVDAFVETLRAKSVAVELEPHDRSFGRLAAVRDPDGNIIYIHKYPDAALAKRLANTSTRGE